MDYRSVSNVLGILRKLRDVNPNHNASDIIREWAAVSSKGAKIRDSVVLRVASYVSEQVDEAASVIANSKLDPEAKHGVNEALEGIQKAFSLKQINSPPRSHIPNVAGAISNLVILLSASGIETQTPPPKEAVELAKEVESLISAFDDGSLDPLVRDLAKQHLQILATMLRHLPIFGLDAAMAAYFELVIKLRRADANTSDTQKEGVKPLMERITGWGKVMSAMDKTYNQGARWIARGKAGLALLGFIDPSAAS